MKAIKATLRKTILKFALSFLLFLGIFGANILNVRAEREYILYVSTGCPHCIEVENFIKKYDLGEKIIVKNLTVDKEFAQEYADFAKENDIPLNEQGTPTLLYFTDDDFEWIVGDTPIKEFFEEEFNLKLENETSFSDYLLLGIGLCVVIFVGGYGIVKMLNGDNKR